MALTFEDWGLIDYREALAKQEALVEKIHQEGSSGILVFCSHPAVVTLGRKTQPGDVFGWQGPVVEIARGGRATYHGPSQLVIYPLLNLDRAPKPRDIAWYLRTLEDSIVRVLASEGVEAVGRSLQKKSESDLEADETGVWVGSRKIASLGIGVRKWISFHGAALNLDRDPSAFSGMRPCGFNREVMVSLEEVRGRKTDRDAIKKALRDDLLRHLSGAGES